MKRLAAGCAVLVALLAPALASAQLSKSSARLEADLTALEFLQRKSWATSQQVGACKRISDARVNCDARVTGDELIECSGETLTCSYVFHVCRFTVAVHEAGYSALGRVQGVRCEAHPHSG